MTDAAFLADILENPDDDAPRLIYADWLDDNDNPERAEFIRLQCYKERGTPAPEAKLREDELLKKHGKAWAGTLHNFVQEYHFRRGFVESMDVYLPLLIAHRAELFARHPIRSIEVHNARTDDVRSFAQLARFGSFAVFSLSATIREAGLRPLLDSPNMQELRGLAIHDTPIGPKGVRALLASTIPGSLTHLSLANTGIGSGVNELAACDKLRSLIGLDLRGNEIKVESLRRIGDSPHLKNLRRLGLWYNRLGNEGVERLVTLPLFSRLQHLELGYNGVTARGIRTLAESPALTNLRSLWMGVDRYTDEGLLALVHSPYLHPEAEVMFWFCNHIAAATREAAREALGDRVQFDTADTHRANNALIRWPLWRPA